MRIWYLTILLAVACAAQDDFRRHNISVIPNTEDSKVGELKFFERRVNGGAHVGFKAPAAITTSLLWQLPSVDGTTGQCLAWASATTLGWAACTGAAADAQPVFCDAVVANGVTNDAPAIQACIDGLPDAGGIVELPCGDIAVGATINLGNGTVAGAHSTKFGVTLRGCGPGTENSIVGDADGIQGATRLKWIGPGLTTKTITNITNATPIQVTSTGHGLLTQQVALLDQAGRNGGCANDNGANGVWSLRVVDANTLELRGSAGNGTFNAGCPGTLYVGSPVIAANGPSGVNMRVENLQVYGSAATSGGITGTLVTANVAAVGIEWRHQSFGVIKNVGIARVAILGLDMRTSNVTGTAVFNCNNWIEQLAIHSAQHQRTSGIRMVGYEVTNGPDSCSNRVYGANVSFGGGPGSYAMEEGFADNNVFHYFGPSALGGPTGGSNWRRVQPFHTSLFPAANVCEQCFFAAPFPIMNPSHGRSLWVPNYGETELEPEVPPFLTSTNLRGFTDRGRFFNTYNQNIDGTAAAPAYGFAADTDTGFFRTGSGAFGFSSNGLQIFEISANGVYSQGALAGYVFNDRTAGFGQAWELYADGNTARLWSFSPNRDVVEVQNIGWMTLRGESTESNYIADVYSSANATDRAGIHLRRARGTIPSPGVVVSGDRLSTIASWGYTSTGPFGGFSVGSRVDTYADTVSGANLTTSMRFATANAGTLADRATLNAAGDWTITGIYSVGANTGDTASVVIGGCTMNFTGGILTSRSGC